MKSEEFVEGSDSIFPLTHSPTQKDSIVVYAYEAVSYKKKKQQRTKQKNKNKQKAKKKKRKPLEAHYQESNSPHCHVSELVGDSNHTAKPASD